jgi:CDP-6-deoxy-D-xylo-4-hexulose-3-dehydrase
MSTMEGGLVTTDDKEIYHILMSLRAHGWTRHLPKENLIANKSDDWFEESFRFLLPGYNVRPIEMSGAVGLEQLKKLPRFLENRRLNAKLFVELFKDSKDFFNSKEY